MTWSIPGARPGGGLAAGVIGAVVWSSVVVLAAFGFASNNVEGSGFSRGFYPYRELLGFAAAFAVAGAVSGVCTLGILAGSRASLAMGLLLILTYGATCLTLWLLPMLAAPFWNPVEWSAMNRERLLAYLLPGVAAGVAIGLLVSVAGAGLWLGCHRGRSRTLGLASAFGLITLMVALVPRASSVISEIGIDLRWKYGWSDTEVMIGAGSGATTGSIAGAITALLVARALRSETPRKAP